MEGKILLVDDEKEIGELVSFYLQGEGLEVAVCQTGGEALALLERETFDLAILDVMLPDLDGFTLCRKIRERHTFPILMLTARDGELDKVGGLAQGADDYITKPFRPLELTARVKAQLRRARLYNQAPPPRQSCLTVREIVLDQAAHQCTRDGKVIPLTPTEFSILWELCREKGRVLSGEELFHRVWKEKYFASSANTVSVHIRHLRDKLKENGGRNPIRTVWGVGYQIEE